MRKFYTVLYLAIILSCMAACGKNDTQAQTPSRQAEPSTIESSSQSNSLNGSENANESSVAMDSTETADETMSESTIVDETEGMAEPVEVILKGCNLVKIMCVVEHTAVNRGVVGSS